LRLSVQLEKVIDHSRRKVCKECPHLHSEIGARHVQLNAADCAGIGNTLLTHLGDPVAVSSQELSCG
jgi:hypothetical protein